MEKSSISNIDRFTEDFNVSHEKLSKVRWFYHKNHWPLGGDKSVKGSNFVTAQP